MLPRSQYHFLRTPVGQDQDQGEPGCLERALSTPACASEFRPRKAYSYIGIMEKKMETTIVYWGYIGIMENKMETTDNGL